VNDRSLSKNEERIAVNFVDSVFYVHKEIGLGLLENYMKYVSVMN
jgi:hypothetical protein